jgi:SAM-dependent methyltransferase
MPSAHDAELEAGTSAHYENPAYYTKTYRDRVNDVHYYVDLATACGGPVLEYGAGNGRIALPIARMGVDVVGVDLSKAMLDDFRARLAEEPLAVRKRVRLKHGDMRKVVLRQRFARVFCPFNAFLHLYTRDDVERFFARARAHLAPDGELVFDLSIPEPIELARDPSHRFTTPRFRYPEKPGDKGTMVRYAERFDYDRVRQILFVTMEFEPQDGREGWVMPLAHRQFFPQELEALLHYNGFELRAWYGDFFEGAIAPGSETLVVHARPKPMRRAR